MTQTKTYCDHCGKELDEMHDYPDIEFDAIDEFLKCDLCKDCYEELSKDIRKFINRDTKCIKEDKSMLETISQVAKEGLSQKDARDLLIKAGIINERGEVVSVYSDIIKLKQ